MQKTHYLGGSERARISEQCLRRALMDGGIMLPLAQQSVRTRQVATMVAKRLQAQGVPEATAAAAGQAVATVVSKGGGGSGEADPEASESKPTKAAKVAVLAISPDEYDGMAAKVRHHLDAGVAPGKLLKVLEKDLREVLRGGAMSIDAKLFGRMVSGVPEARSTGCLGNTAAVGTHAVEDFLDTFVAVDRHAPIEHGSGAGHFDEKHHTGSVFVADWWLDKRLAREHSIDPEGTVEGLVRGLAGLVIRPQSGKTAVPLETIDITVEAHRHGSFGPSAEAFRVPVAPTGQAAVETLKAWLTRRDLRLGGPIWRHWLAEEGLGRLLEAVRSERPQAA